VRVADDVTLGQAKVTISFEGWPEGRVSPSTHTLPVVPRNPLPTIRVSPEQMRVVTADGYSAEEVRFTPDGRSLIVVLSRRVQGERLYQFHLWDAATGRGRYKLHQIDPEPLRIVYSPYLTVSADGKLLAIRYNVLRFIKEGKDYRRDNLFELHVFDLGSGRELWRRETVGRECLGATFSPDGRTLVTGESSAKEADDGKTQVRQFTGEVCLWDAATGRKRASLSGGPYQLVSSVGYSPDGKYLLIEDEHRGKGSEEHQLIVWDLAAGTAKIRLSGPGPYSGTLSPNGRQLATVRNTWLPEKKAYERDVRVWDLGTGRERAALPLNPGPGWVHEPVWSADGRFLYFASYLGRLWRWDPSGVEPLASVDSVGPEPAGQRPEREAREQDAHAAAGLFAFGVNGKLPERLTKRNLADDYAELPPAEIVLWDLRTMKRRATLTGHHGQINHLAFSPDGKTLVSGGTDGTVRFWRVGSE
jgi:WD40 repeat protein